MPVKVRPKERRSKFHKLDDVADPILLGYFMERE